MCVDFVRPHHKSVGFLSVTVEGVLFVVKRDVLSIGATHVRNCYAHVFATSLAVKGNMV